MGLFEEIHAEVGGILDGPLAIALAEVAAHLGEEVESALGLVDLQAGDLRSEFNHEVAAALEGHPHLLDTLLTACIGGLGGLLGNRRGAGGVLALELGHSLGYGRGSGAEADAPAGHGIGFRHAVDHHGAVGDMLKRSERGKRAGEVDVLVDLVGHHYDLGMLGKHLHKAHELLACVHAAGGVGGGADEHHAGAGVMAARSCSGVILKSCSMPAGTSTFLPSASFTIST